MADFHRRMQQAITSRSEGAKLYLAGGTMLENRHTQYRLRPTLLHRTRLDEAMTELGIRTADYGKRSTWCSCGRNICDLRWAP